MNADNEKQLRLSLSGYALKTIAVAAMIIDHAAYLFCDAASPLGIVLHFIGRLTAPIMCYFLAEGYYHTGNFRWYAMRLFVFALISQVPFQLVINKGVLTFPPPVLNVLFTLLCGLLALRAWDTIQNESLRRAAVCGLMLLTSFMDWPIFGVLFIFVFALNRGDRRAQLTAYAWACVGKVAYSLLLVLAGAKDLVTVISALGVFCVISLLMLYNGKRGGERTGKLGKQARWLFYIAYPAHLLLLGILYRGYMG